MKREPSKTLGVIGQDDGPCSNEYDLNRSVVGVFEKLRAREGVAHQCGGLERD
jgi:hypothetical protein